MAATAHAGVTPLFELVANCVIEKYLSLGIADAGWTIVAGIVRQDLASGTLECVAVASGQDTPRPGILGRENLSERSTSLTKQSHLLRHSNLFRVGCKGVFLDGERTRCISFPSPRVVVVVVVVVVIVVVGVVVVVVVVFVAEVETGRAR